MSAVRRVGNFLQVQDGDGCRHLLRVTSVQALSDTDLMRNETFITAAGRTIITSAGDCRLQAIGECGHAEGLA